MVRIYLAIVGVIYVVLALWCATDPEGTAKSVGFSLTQGSGESEYFTVYVGLQLALGVVFLLPLIRPEQTSYALQCCLVVFAGLVLCRTIAFLRFSGIQTPTYMLAAAEWFVLLVGVAVWKMDAKGKT